jgi:hypothetical protein
MVHATRDPCRARIAPTSAAATDPAALPQACLTYDTTAATSSSDLLVALLARGQHRRPATRRRLLRRSTSLSRRLVPAGTRTDRDRAGNEGSQTV